jgi:hypothetical protein
MTLPPLSTILATQTQAQIEATLIAFLQNPGNGLPALPATSWGATSYGPYLVGSESLVLSQVYQSIQNLTMGGYFQLASSSSLVSPTTGTSPWVDYGAQQFYNQLRMQAQPTIGPFQFTTTASAGPYTVAAGQLQILSATGTTYTNVLSITIPNNGTAVATVQAVNPGSAGNIANGTTLSLITSLPGVTVQTYPNSGTTAWYTVPYTDTNTAQAGSDLESDSSLIARCLNQWVAMGTGSPMGAYINWAFAASNEVRYALPVATGLGSVAFYVYGSGGQVSSVGLTSIANYITNRMPLCSFIAPGSPVNAVPLQINPTGGPINFAATIYGPSTSSATGLASAAAALQLLVSSTPVGGYRIGPGIPETFGISNSDFVTAIQESNSAITKVSVSVSGVPGGDFVMTPASGVPRIAQVPPLPSNPTSTTGWNMTWQAV